MLVKFAVPGAALMKIQVSRRYVYLPLYCNVCVCEGFVTCGCFGSMYTVLRLRFLLNPTEVFLTLTEGFP